jgi:Fur family ferric uptake transcriptional regulator
MDFPSDLRKTKPREAVWGILCEAQAPLTAREIARKVADHSGEKETSGSVWLSSIYRALDAFEKSHVVTKTILSDSQEAMYSISTPGHHHYAICVNCKSRTELTECPFEEEHALHTKDSDFMVIGHTVEVYGYCKSCQSKMRKDLKER